MRPHAPSPGARRAVFNLQGSTFWVTFQLDQCAKDYPSGFHFSHLMANSVGHQAAGFAFPPWPFSPGQGHRQEVMFECSCLKIYQVSSMNPPCAGCWEVNRQQAHICQNCTGGLLILPLQFLPPPASALVPAGHNRRHSYSWPYPCLFPRLPFCLEFSSQLQIPGVLEDNFRPSLCDALSGFLSSEGKLLERK